MNNSLSNVLIISYFLAFFLFYQYYYLIIIIFYLVYLLKKQTNYIISIISIILGIVIFLSLNNIKPPAFTNPYFKVINVNKSSYYIKNNEGSLVLYTSQKLKMNDEIKISLNIEKINMSNNFNIFDYQFYLRSKNIYHQVKDDSLIVTKTSINNNNLFTNYYELFFSNNKSLINSEINDIFIQLSIIHLIVISGFHFNLLYKILINIFCFIKNNLFKQIIIFLLLLIFLASLNYSIPALKAFFVLLLKVLFEKKYQLKSLDALSVVGVVLLVLRPYYLLDISFLLTFFISYIINLIPSNIKESKFKLSLILYLFIIPLISNMNYEISIFSFVYTLILTPIIIFLYPIVILGYFLQLNSLEFILIYFEKLLLLINKTNILINTGKLSIGIILGYYYILIKIISSHKPKINLKLLIFYICIIIYSYLPTYESSITFMNFKQNDCIVIKRAFKNDVMIIDVGQSDKEKNVENILVPYLKSMKIKYIKVLVLSHNDMDHRGGYLDLNKYYYIEKVINKKQKEIKYHDLVFIDPMYDRVYKDENANSISLYTRINGLNYFFAADINSNVEFDIINRYQEFKIDVLKVAHHGSKSSSSADFLLKSNPKIAFISRGLNNRYHHPHIEVINRYQKLNIIVYDSAIDGGLKIFNMLSSNYLITSE